MTKRDLFYAGTTIWDRANPVKALYGWMERPIADMRTAELTTMEASELGTLFAAAPDLLEACEAAMRALTDEECAALTLGGLAAVASAQAKLTKALARAKGEPAPISERRGGRGVDSKSGDSVPAGTDAGT